MRETKLFINGEFRSSSDNKTFENKDPATGEVLSRCHLPSVQDIDLAVKSAHQAFYSDEWRKFSPTERSELLLNISEKIKERKKEFIDLEIRDSGSVVRKAKADIHNTASFFKVMSKVAAKFHFEQKDEQASREGFSVNTRLYQPVGVCAQVIPWNFPLVMAGWKIGPVLATGCTTVLKSAGETPETAALLAEVIQTAGCPKGVVNIITGHGEEGAHLIQHPLVRKIAFTGSTQVGREILKAAASDIKKTTLELGGKSANIVFDDADLDIAVDGALYAFLYHSGQACDSGTRLFIQDKIYDQFLERFLQRMKDIKIGQPQDPTAGMGPVISEKQFNSIMAYIEKTQAEGAKTLIGGNRLTGGDFDKGFYIAPTAFEITPDNTIFHEEIFGPVVGIQKFATEEQVVELANNSIYGLAAGVWGKDSERNHRVARRLEAGTVWINEYHLLNPGMPFGGYKQSGIGREMGTEGLLAYLETKHLWESDCDKREQKVWFDALF